MVTSHKHVAHPKPMLWFSRDLPNLVSLAGLASALLGIYYAILGVYPAAMIGLVWAIAFDWLDGCVAKGMKGRTSEQSAYGANLDSLIDIVSFGVAPAVVLLSIGRFDPWYLPGAFVILAAAAVRLSYFNVFGLAQDSSYRGLALDNNVILLVALFVFRGAIGASAFAVVLYAMLMLLAALNVSTLRTPKLSGNWYYAIVAR
ncbi:MAG: CDP-alcohol phosphatidyltransferase family protein [Coriobacteriia bacterium]|nr:CDP-alcohol phosphatidyltransferase family protein [Coriobacteriia bacterium]